MANSRTDDDNREDNIFVVQNGADARHFRRLLFTTKSTFAAIVSRFIVPKDRAADDPLDCDSRSSTLAANVNVFG